MNSPVRLGVSLAATSTPTGVFNQRLYLSTQSLSPGPPAAASPASCSFARPAPQSTTSLGLPATTLPLSFPPRLPVSAPPTSLGECFFFISLVVGLPYRLVFCQFWLFFVFKLFLSFFWLCEEAQCVYPCLHLGQKSWFPFFETTGGAAVSILHMCCV